MNQKFDATRFSKVLKTKRVIECDAGLREAAKQIKVSAATLSRMENEKTSDLENVLKVCNWLKVPLSDFIIDEPMKKSKSNKKS